jgi:hypothetical protein
VFCAVNGENGFSLSFQNYQKIANMWYLNLISIAVAVVGARGYIPHEKVRRKPTLNSYCTKFRERHF